MTKRLAYHFLLIFFTLTCTLLTPTTFAAAQPSDVSAGKLEIVGPNGGEVFTPGSIYQLKWHYSGAVGSRIKINLLKDGQLVQEISPVVPVGTNGTGVFKWPVPRQIAQSDQYQIELQSIDYPNVIARSESAFAIRGWLTVTLPAENAVWTPGEPELIRWNHGGYPGKHVKITLLEADNPVAVIDDSANLENLVAAWLVPENFKQADGYRVQVQSIENPLVSGTSKPFAIRGHLKLKEPNNTGTYTADSGCKITWSAAGVGPSIKILLVRDGAVVKTIAEAVPAAKQEFVWDAKAEPGANYKIRIIANSQPEFVAESQETFELK